MNDTDTQSWFHSQEINILVDSPQLVRDFMQGLDANQNTSKYGKVDTSDGVWRDASGEVVQATGTQKSGFLGKFKGFSGAVARVRSQGGFI
jgi:hypothetical protein